VATRAWRLMQLLLISYEILDQGEFLLVDVETSSLHPERAEILEVGVIPFAAGAVAGTGLVSLVRPSAPRAIDADATDIHGLRWRDVADAPPANEALPPLLVAMDGQVIVGHNIEAFDLPVLLRAVEHAGLAFRQPQAIDTRRMAERLWPDEASYRLEDLARRVDPKIVQRHRAREDCLLTGQVFQMLLHDARREREIDILSECLPVVAASIVGSELPVANDNALLVGIGGRAIAQGHGADLFAIWERAVSASVAASVRDMLTGAAIVAEDDDARWQRLVDGWQAIVETLCRGEPDLKIDRFLRYAALAQPIDALPRGDVRGDDPDPRLLSRHERVNLMTVHSAKGLEWPVVLLVGVEDDQFPHFNTNSEEQMAEERRILYVAMTRARDRLYLFSAQNRNGYAKRRSRFLEPLIGPFIDEVSPSKP
jgi:DNA polymerase-3 subunit epsilon